MSTSANQGIVQVVAAVIESEGRYLLGKRSPDKNSAPGYWCPICGKVEKTETQPEAVAREVFEEVGLKVKAIEKLGEFDTRDGSARIHWWKTEIVNGTVFLRNAEHTELRWVTLKEMRELAPIFEEDIEVFSQLEQRGESQEEPT